MLAILALLEVPCASAHGRALAPGEVMPAARSQKELQVTKA